ncbi:hypothetical protein BHE74_00048863 [Ensete ventricosum]|nr:hypothetical protein BHE74_00048863 [Ensete ventricosum]RZS06050.1 hypothetical protein BHM03_00036643 [Ensete ventricosum]
MHSPMIHKSCYRCSGIRDWMRMISPLICMLCQGTIFPITDWWPGNLLTGQMTK